MSAISLSRDQARAVWSGRGLTNSDLTAENLRLLQGMINQAMMDSGLLQGSYRASQRFSLGIDAEIPWADLRCRSYYLEGRQAVTFERNGFVGFAGWADEYHVQPILIAFGKWVDLLTIDDRKEGHGP